MRKIDITLDGNEELYNQIQNDPFMVDSWNRYVRRGRFQDVKSMIDEFFLYTEDQLEDLKETFESSVEEYNK